MEELGDFGLKDIKYGLIAIDTNQEGEEFLDILHFCGYEEEPTENEVIDLYRELSEDEEWGLTEMMDRILIIPAPQEIVESYRNIDEEE